MSRDGWGPYAESFIRTNKNALAALDVAAEVDAVQSGLRVRLRPGGRTGAVPLRDPQTEHVRGGLVVSPRFGWAGVGAVLRETGWAAGPDFLDLPLVPGSGREIPPWVLAGPALARLSELLRSLRTGFRELEEVRRRPRGRILWSRYAAESLARGKWDRVPCRFPDLDTDPHLRRVVRWAVERVRTDLIAVAPDDVVARDLVHVAISLIDELRDVPPLAPRREELQSLWGGNRFLGEAARRGIEALGWIVDERGLAGGRELDGLAWQLPLDRLWEAYVESVVRNEAGEIGAEVRVGRLGQTTVALNWSDPLHRTLGHLAPDIVVRRGRSVRVVDAKYKAHLAELDESGWRRFADETKERHRADLHQVLAYAALYDADEVTATLAYPLRQSTWERLNERRQDRALAELSAGGRSLRLELWGLPFGGARSLRMTSP